MTTRAKAVEMTNRWNEVLTQEQRDMWTQYAGSLGSAVDREKSDNVAKTKNVIPKRSKLMSGLNAYIKSNIVEYLADGGGPDDIAPIGDQTPPPPLNVEATFDGSPLPFGGIKLTWTDPILTGTPTKKKVRIWLKSITKPKAQTQIIAHQSFGAVQPYTIHNIRFSKATIDVLQVRGSRFTIQMDTVIQSTTGRGAIIGPGSNVSEVFAYPA